MERILSAEGEEIKATKFKGFASIRSLVIRNSNHKELCKIPEAQRKRNFLISDFYCDM